MMKATKTEMNRKAREALADYVAIELGLNRATADIESMLVRPERLRSHTDRRRPHSSAERKRVKAAIEVLVATKAKRKTARR